MQSTLPATAALVALATALAALSGCTQVADVDADASLSFDGTGSGSHSDSASCGSDATLRGEGTVVHGSLRVQLSDGDGQTLFDQTYNGRIEPETFMLDGHAGTWRLEATRSGETLGEDFDGEYLFRLHC